MNESTGFVVRPFHMAALASLLLLARPATAQFVIAPDRSVVYLGPQRPLPFQGSFSLNPVVVGGNRYVRIGGSISAMVAKPAPHPGTGFIKPWTAGERARAANFPNAPNYNPNPVFTGPWRQWW